MPDTFGDIAFSVLYDGDGAMPLPSYAAYGSTRHVANSAIDLTQYTGSGPGVWSGEILATKSAYDNLVSAFTTFPRVAQDLTITDVMTGSCQIDALGPAKVYLGTDVRATITFRTVV